MSNLNQNLYSRFGIEPNLLEVQRRCKKYFKSLIFKSLDPIINPDGYQQKEELWDIQSEVLSEICRQLFLDEDDWEASYKISGFGQLVSGEISDKFHGPFNQYLLRLQILLNIIFKHDFVRSEFSRLVQDIEKYLIDFPILDITLKIYKNKAAQILPTTSKKFETEIKNTLGLLELDKKYEHSLSDFENGLKEFLTAKDKANYKDVIEDMYTACDNLIKAILDNREKGFKHISDKGDAAILGLNGHQKELYKNLRNWMDEIKHGTIKDFDRNDVEMIISLVSSLIRFLLVKKTK